jgi:hypothetical protein
MIGFLCELVHQALNEIGSSRSQPVKPMFTRKRVPVPHHSHASVESWELIFRH